MKKIAVVFLIAFGACVSISVSAQTFKLENPLGTVSPTRYMGPGVGFFKANEIFSREFIVVKNEQGRYEQIRIYPADHEMLQKYLGKPIQVSYYPSGVNDEYNISAVTVITDEVYEQKTSADNSALVVTNTGGTVMMNLSKTASSVVIANDGGVVMLKSSDQP